MQFHVPQFIDVEDKIFGSLSAKQFAYVGGGVGAIFIFYSLTGSLFFGFILGSPILAFGLALAFYKINNRSFIHMVEAAFKYSLNSHLYIWKKVPKVPTHNEDGSIEEEVDVFVPKLSDSKLKDIAWSLDIQEKDSIYSNMNQR